MSFVQYEKTQTRSAQLGSQRAITATLLTISDLSSRATGVCRGRRRESRDLQLSLGEHPSRRPLEVGGLQVVPILAQISPRGICFSNQSQLLLAPPRFQLFFTRDCSHHILMALKPNEAITLVPLSEPLIFSPFMLKYTLEE